MAIVLTLDVQLERRGMSVAELAEAIGITPANVFVLKSGRAKAVRFTTLDAICRVLKCQPGDILAYEP
ncbi:MAG: helix-turn-helix transcriptional regulator [Microbacterium sp.]